MAKASDIIKIAQGELGYIEGKNNNTKYGKEYGLNYNAWCMMFCWWVLKKAGMDEGTEFPKTASCPTGLKWFRNKGWLHTTPKPGDLIFFKWASNKTTAASHVGFVTKVSDAKVYTVEGNAGTNSDRVTEKSYVKSYGSIVGYGRPPYDAEDIDERPRTDKEAVKGLQTALNKAYNAKLDVDGILGPKTTAAVSNHTIKYLKTGAYVKWVQQRLTDIGFRGTMGKPDGIFGPRTRRSVQDFQKASGLVVDGIVGIKTVTALVEYAE